MLHIHSTWGKIAINRFWCLGPKSTFIPLSSLRHIVTFVYWDISYTWYRHRRVCYTSSIWPWQASNLPSCWWHKGHRVSLYTFHCPVISTLFASLFVIASLIQNYSTMAGLNGLFFLTSWLLFMSPIFSVLLCRTRTQETTHRIRGSISRRYSWTSERRTCVTFHLKRHCAPVLCV